MNGRSPAANNAEGWSLPPPGEDVKEADQLAALAG